MKFKYYRIMVHRPNVGIILMTTKNAIYKKSIAKKLYLEISNKFKDCYVSLIETFEADKTIQENKKFRLK